MNSLHHRLQNLEGQLHTLEGEADALDLPRVRFALLDAYTRLTNAGTALIDAHLLLGRLLENLPTTPESGDPHE